MPSRPAMRCAWTRSISFARPPSSPTRSRKTPRTPRRGVIRRAESDISDKQREFLKEKQQVERHGREAEQKRDRAPGRGREGSSRDARQGRARGEPEAEGRRGAWRTLAGAGAPPGDRADEQRSRGDRSVARVGSLAGDGHRPPRARRRRAAPRRGRPRRCGARSCGQVDCGRARGRAEEELGRATSSTKQSAQPPASTSSDSDAG